MLELMLALAALAILLVVATRYYNQANVAAGVNHAVSMVENTHSATQNWAFGRSAGFSGVSKSELITYGLLPDDFSSNNINPFGGDLDVNGSAHTFNIMISNVPKTACAQLVSRLSQNTQAISPPNAGDCSENQSMTFTYGNN